MGHRKKNVYIHASHIHTHKHIQYVCVHYMNTKIRLNKSKRVGKDWQRKTGIRELLLKNVMPFSCVCVCVCVCVCAGVHVCISKSILVCGMISQVALVLKNLPANAGDLRGAGSIPGSGRRRAWQPTPVFFPGESHGQRSLAGYCLWGLKRVRHD